MRNRVETHIEAPPERVWAFISDFSTYPHWNPLTPRVEGRCEAGARVRAWVQLRGDPFLMPRRILDVRPAARFAWTSATWYAWMVPGERVLTLTAVDGGTLLVDEERIGGLGFLIRGTLRAAVLAKLEAFGAGLKRVSEGGGAAIPRPTRG